MSAPGSLAPLLESFFRDRLTRQRNASSSTIGSYRDALRLLVLFAAGRTGRKPVSYTHLDVYKRQRRILAWLHDHHPAQPLTAITGEHVLGLVGHLLSLSANNSTRSSTTSYVRTFLRFLRWAGLNGQDLARFVPRTPCWRLQHLPPQLAWEDIRRAIDAIDVTAASGARDRALLLLLATTGLRNKEIRMLELRDIHWRTAEVFVRRTKGKRDRVVPLLDEAGAALADYVLHARPKIDNSCVFLLSLIHI